MGDAGGASESVKVGFRLDSNLLSAAAVSILFLVSFFLWTLPFQHNRLPFGEGDSAWHFAIGDNIASSDKATFRLPYYVGIWYYSFNRILGPFAPEYLPSSHVNYALMQFFGGERFVPVFIYRAIASFLGALAVFFVISRLFGVLPGFLAGLGLSFSLREQMTYLFGQQPTLTAILITPVATYAWYKYLASFYDNDSSGTGSGGNKTYLFVTLALLASQYMLHIQGFAASSILIAVFTVLMVIRFRRLPVSKANIANLAVAAVIFAAVAAPFAAIYFGAPENPPSFKVGRLFEWGISPDYVVGSFPPAFVLFSAEYHNYLLAFLFAGIALLLVRVFLVKNNVKELFLLSWLIGTYVVLHSDLFLVSNTARLARMLVLEHYIFFSLIALSVVWLPSTVSSLIKLDKSKGVVFVAKYALASVLVISLVLTSGKATYSSLKDAYGGIARLTPVQAEFAEWLGANVPEKAYIYDPASKIIGQWQYPKLRWMLAISQRHVGTNDFSVIATADNIDKNNTYFLFDYSDAALLASSPAYQQQALAWAAQLQQLERSVFNNTAPVYDSNNIRLYRYDMTKDLAKVTAKSITQFAESVSEATEAN